MAVQSILKENKMKKYTWITYINPASIDIATVSPWGGTVEIIANGESLTASGEQGRRLAEKLAALGFLKVVREYTEEELAD